MRKSAALRLTLLAGLLGAIGAATAFTLAGNDQAAPAAAPATDLSSGRRAADNAVRSYASRVASLGAKEREAQQSLSRLRTEAGLSALKR